jgi:uncharacterized protein YbcC (UPF0753/DUF2309 family)
MKINCRSNVIAEQNGEHEKERSSSSSNPRFQKVIFYHIISSVESPRKEGGFFRAWMYKPWEDALGKQHRMSTAWNRDSEDSEVVF